MKKQRFLVYTEYVFDGVFDVVAESTRRKHGRKSCNIVGWLWVEVFTAPCPMMR